MTHPLTPAAEEKPEEALWVPALWFFLVERSRTPSEKRSSDEKNSIVWQSEEVFVAFVIEFSYFVEGELSKHLEIPILGY